MHLFAYFYAPCTRALEQLWMCRSVAGSGDPADPDGVYQGFYLKSDLQYVCHGSEHMPVLIVSAVLWTLYAVCCPLATAYIIGRHQSKNAAIHRENEAAQARGDFMAQTHVPDDYWHSCTMGLILLFHSEDLIRS